MGDTVTVACKIPNGLLLRVFDMVSSQEPVLGGGMRETRTAVQKGEQVKVSGPAIPRGPDLNEQVMEGLPQLAGGYALTHGVDADFFETWLEQNKDSDVVKNGLIFAHSKPADARAESKEKTDVRSGLEPLAQSKDPRAPRNVKIASDAAA